MSESEPDEGYRISRALESVDREIRLRKRDHAGERESPPFERGEAPLDGMAAEGAEERAAERNGTEENFPVRPRRFRGTPIQTPARMLLSDGISLPSPAHLCNGREVQSKLWEVIEGLAARRVYLRNTNHLTDRELYVALWAVHLNEVMRDRIASLGRARHIDLRECGAAGEEGFLLGYDVEPAKANFWRRKFIRDRGPERRDLRYDRDRYLPREGPR